MCPICVCRLTMYEAICDTEAIHPSSVQICRKQIDSVSISDSRDNLGATVQVTLSFKIVWSALIRNFYPVILDIRGTDNNSTADLSINGYLQYVRVDPSLANFVAH